MPAYDYRCSKCDTTWEEIRKIAEHDAPERLPCPHCSKKKCVQQVVLEAPAMAMDKAHRIDGKATGGFRDVMQKIAEGPGVKGGKLEKAIKRRYL